MSKMPPNRLLAPAVAIDNKSDSSPWRMPDETACSVLLHYFPSIEGVGMSWTLSSVPGPGTKVRVNRSIGITEVQAQYLNAGRPCLLIGAWAPRFPADSDSVGLLPAIFIICFALRYDLKQPSSASNPATAI